MSPLLPLRLQGTSVSDDRRTNVLGTGLENHLNKPLPLEAQFP